MPTEVARVIIFGPEETEIFIEVPVQDRDPDELRQQLLSNVHEYISIALQDEKTMSVADFAFFMLTKAEEERR